MSDKFEILYPRKQGVIYIHEFTKESDILAEIKEIEKTEVYKHYLQLHEELKSVRRDKAELLCGHCGVNSKLKDLVLYDVVSYSNTIDEDRYDDYSVVCPKCKKHNIIREKDKYNGFKKIEEIK